MRRRLTQQTAPDHWNANGAAHHPRRCLLCNISRIGQKLGIIGPEEER